MLSSSCKITFLAGFRIYRIAHILLNAWWFVSLFQSRLVIPSALLFSVGCLPGCVQLPKFVTALTKPAIPTTQSRGLSVLTQVRIVGGVVLPEFTLSVGRAQIASNARFQLVSNLFGHP